MLQTDDWCVVRKLVSIPSVSVDPHEMLRAEAALSLALLFVKSPVTKTVILRSTGLARSTEVEASIQRMLKNATFIKRTSTYPNVSLLCQNLLSTSSNQDYALEITFYFFLSKEPFFCYWAKIMSDELYRDE